MVLFARRYLPNRLEPINLYNQELVISKQGKYIGVILESPG